MGYIIGVDEAGRGPVVGPMVLCAFACMKEQEAGLREIGVKDSKLVPEGKREKMVPKLKEFPHVVVEVSAAEITEYMRKHVSLNDMEALKIAEALSKLAAKLEIDTVFVDSPDPVASKFAIRIKKYLPQKLKSMHIVSENKADVKYACAGAASLIAKSTRERRVADIALELGEAFGSGYPSDERTMEFVRRRRGEPLLEKHLRHEWETIKKMRTAKVKLEDFG